MSFSPRSSRVGTALLVLVSLGGFLPRSSAQTPTFGSTSLAEVWNINPVPGLLDSTPSATALARTPRLRLFRITPGFLSDPLGMHDDESSGLPGMLNLPATNPIPAVHDDGPEWIQVGMGSDVPLFDLRCPGDPGGFGYYRVNTQMALLDSPTTACSLGLQTVTPAGAQFGGLPSGPTVVIPAFSVFHALSDRLALQGFVSKNVPLFDASGAYLQRHVQCGLALQRPLLAEAPEGLRDLYFSFGALGQLAPQHECLRVLPQCNVLPGFQWHVNENWWLTSAVLMPVGPVRTTPGQWQLTCSLRF